MTYHGVECEKVDNITAEQYVCRWADRNTLAIGVLAEGKGVVIKEKPGIENAKGILKRTFALITVDSYSPIQAIGSGG